MKRAVRRVFLRRFLVVERGEAVLVKRRGGVDRNVLSKRVE